MPAQMLETSQLERLWLHVLIRVEKKKRFLNDPQLTRGLVIVLVFLLVEIIKKPNRVQECCRNAAMSLHGCVNIEDNEVLCVCACKMVIMGMRTHAYAYGVSINLGKDLRRWQ